MRAGDVLCAVRWCTPAGVAADEALAVEVAVDGHGGGREVMLAAAEVVRVLMLGWRHRDDRLAGGAASRHPRRRRLPLRRPASSRRARACLDVTVTQPE